MTTDDVVIDKHIKHTNNTLIFGQLNGNASQGVPSLGSSLVGEDNMGVVVSKVFGEDDSVRLEVSTFSDVTRIFKPTYFFSVAEESVDGVNTMVVEHSLKHRAGALAVEVSPDSLCFRILASKGSLKLDDITNQIRNSVRKARDHYLAVTKSQNPARMLDHKRMRADLISQLLEPVVAYLLMAEATGNYRIIEQVEEKPTESDAALTQVIELIVPDFSEGNWDLKVESIEVRTAPDFEIQQADDKTTVEARIKIESEIRQGRRYVASAVKDYLKSAVDEQSLSWDKRELVDALVESGVSQELMLDDITEDAPAHALLTATGTRYLERKPHLALDAPEGDAPDASRKGIEPNEIGQMQTEERGGKALTTHTLAEKMRADLTTEELNLQIHRIREAALQAYGNDEEKQEAITTYLQTLTSVGKIENQFLEIQKKGRIGVQEAKGEKGFKLFLKLCLEEAAERSPLVRKFRHIYSEALLQEPHKIKAEHEERWLKFHDHLLQTAKKTFEDYMGTLSPLASDLMGIDTFLRTVKSAVERPPRVLIANMDVDHLLADEAMKSQFIKFVAALNSVAQEEFERAISLAIVPRLDDFHKDQLFKIAYDTGFTTFFGTEDAIEFNSLNDREKLDELINEWSSKDQEQVQYQSAVLCVPDNILLPIDFRFRLGEFLATRQTCYCDLASPITVPSCFHAAALVARNDDAKVVKEALKGKRGVKIEDKWPCVGMRFDEEGHENLWESDALSEGAILEENLEGALPMCIFEHRKDGTGKPKKQRIRQLNSLHVLGDRPVPVYEYRAGRYLKRALRLNYPRGAKKSKVKIFASNLRGIWKEGFVNSIFDGKIYQLEVNDSTGYFRIKYKPGDMVVTGFDTGIEEAGDES